MEILYGLALIAVGMVIGAIVTLKGLAHAVNDGMDLNIEVDGKRGMYKLIRAKKYDAMEAACDASIDLYNHDQAHGERELSARKISAALTKYNKICLAERKRAEEEAEIEE